MEILPYGRLQAPGGFPGEPNPTFREEITPAPRKLFQKLSRNEYFPAPFAEPGPPWCPNQKKTSYVNTTQGRLLAQSGDRAALNLRVLSSSPTLGEEPIQKTPQYLFLTKISEKIINKF